MSNKFDNDVSSANCGVIVIFPVYGQFVSPIYGQLEESGSRILDTKSVKLTFSLTVTFCLPKTENITKQYLTQLSYYCFE